MALTPHGATGLDYDMGHYDVLFPKEGTVEFSAANASGTDYAFEGKSISNEANFKPVASTHMPECGAGTRLKAHGANFCYFAVQAQGKHESTSMVLTYDGGRMFPPGLEE